MIADGGGKPGIPAADETIAVTPDLPDPTSLGIRKPASSYQCHTTQPRISFVCVKPHPNVLSWPLLQWVSNFKNIFWQMLTVITLA